MNAELSSMIKLGIAYVLTSALASTVVMLLMIGDINMRHYTNRIALSVGWSQQATMQQATGRVISGPSAFRILQSNSSLLENLTIRIGSNTYYDYNVLVNNGNDSKQYYFDAICTDGVMWTVTLREV